MKIFIVSYLVTASLLLGFYWFNSLKHYSFRYLVPSIIGDVIGAVIVGVLAGAIVKALFHL